MKTNKKSLKPQYKWADLAKELQEHFIQVGMITIAGVIIEIMLLIFVKEKQVALLFLIGLLGYVLWKAYYYLQAISGNILTFIGVVESVDINEKSINGPITQRPKYTLYGKSSVVMSIKRTNEAGVTEEAKFIVPTSANFGANPGNTLIVFALKNSVFKKNNNTFNITNPILVKIFST